MLRRIDQKNMGKGDYDWLKSNYHFSFSDYHNPDNMQFGVLRVLNDDIVAPNKGFDTHPHRDMEIITYIVDGELTHKDSMGSERALNRGHVQYMSAGTGVTHSEENMTNDPLHLVQIWILPDQKGYKPNYGDMTFDFNDRFNKWLHIVSSQNGTAPIKINQDANIFVTYLEKEKDLYFSVEKNRQAYLVILEGSATINDIHLNEKDALEVIEENLLIHTEQNTHLLMIEMKKSN